MTELDFDFLRVLLHRRSGLFLSSEKRYLVESRLGMLCRRRGIAGIPTLVNLLRASPVSELEAAVVEAMTTNETLFFRDRTPFDLFRNIILPEKLAANAQRRTLRIWCAAVSTGQEAYSLAMLFAEQRARWNDWTIDILGTDVARSVVGAAREGAHGVQAVVGDEPGPDERPERVDRLARIAAAGGVVQLGKERRTARLEVIDDRSLARL